MYSREMLEEVINWCIAAKVHLICDEVRRPTDHDCCLLLTLTLTLTGHAQPRPECMAYAPCGEDAKQQATRCVELHAGLLAESPCCRVQVYAMSMFGKDATFTSAAIVAEDLAAKNPVDTESIKHLVHIVFGVSKVGIDGLVCSKSNLLGPKH